MPIFSNSSSAMRSSPQVGLLLVISAMSFRNWVGMRGRPRGRDLCFQNKRKPWRMPTDQGIGFDDGEGIPPVEKIRQSSQRKADRIGRPAWFRFLLDKKSELFTQKQIFGRDGGGGPETELYKSQCVAKYANVVRNMCKNKCMARFY
jgi:hypothetical protein